MILMTIKELEDKHHHLIWKSINEEVSLEKQHTKLSIQFAIGALEEIWEREDFGDDLQSKIQELKQYLDEEI